MLIDWFTVGAQAVNFLILVWLLRRYLYRPVLAAIDAREKTVAAKLADAAARETQSQVAGEELRRQTAVFDRERAGLMRKATDEAAAQREHLSELARQDSQLLRAKLTQALVAERAELGRQLSQRTQVEVFAVARKALSDLAGASLEDRIVDVFIARLLGLPQQQRPPLPSAAADSGPFSGAALHAVAHRVILVRSAFEPQPAGRAKLEAAIRESFGTNVTVCFETSAECVCGIELTVGGVKLPWSVADYLASLAQDVAALSAAGLAAPSAPQIAAPKEAVNAH